MAKMPWPKLKHPPQAPGLDVEAATLTVPGSGFLKNSFCSAGANFYAGVTSDCDRPTWLPFGFSGEAAESFVIYSITKPGAGNRLSLAESGK